MTWGHSFSQANAGKYINSRKAFVKIWDLSDFQCECAPFFFRATEDLQISHRIKFRTDILYSPTLDVVERLANALEIDAFWLIKPLDQQD